MLAGSHIAQSVPSCNLQKGGPTQKGVACVSRYSAGADEYAGETMQRLCSAALDFQATMYSLPIRAEYNIHVETLALFSKISTSVARQVAPCPQTMQSCLLLLPPAVQLGAVTCFPQPGRALLQGHQRPDIAVADAGMRCPIVP